MCLHFMFKWLCPRSPSRLIVLRLPNRQFVLAAATMTMTIANLTLSLLLLLLYFFLNSLKTKQFQCLTAADILIYIQNIREFTYKNCDYIWDRKKLPKTKINLKKISNKIKSSAKLLNHVKIRRKHWYKINI